MKFVVNISEQGRNLRPKILFEFDQNHPVEHQYGDTECGIYSIFFIAQAARSEAHRACSIHNKRPFITIYKCVKLVSQRQGPSVNSEVAIDVSLTPQSCFTKLRHTHKFM